MNKSNLNVQKTDKYRSWQLVLYDDNPEHVKALDWIREHYRYAAIRHDLDCWSVSDQEENPEHVAGELKKAHWHVLLRFQNARYASSLASEIGIEERFLLPSFDFKHDLRYLIHADHPDKFQYDKGRVEGTLLIEFNKALKEDKSEDESVLEILSIIESWDFFITTTFAVNYFSQCGLYSVFRRGFAMYSKIISEHNIPYLVKSDNPTFNSQSNINQFFKNRQ